MTFTDAVVELFLRHEAPKDAPRVEIKRGVWMWKAVPLEWNQAKRLADLVEQPVRMVSEAGLVMRRYDPGVPEPRKEGA